MAVCKRCGSAIPIGKKTCDMCESHGVPPAAGQVAWQAPAAAQWQAPAVPAGAPVEYASSSASWIQNAGAAGPIPAERAPKVGFLMRTIAYFIDSIAIGLPVLALSLNLLRDQPALMYGISFGVSMLYFVFFWSAAGKGQTVGMWMLHMKVVKTDGSYLSATGAFIRYCSFILASLPLYLGLIWVAIDDKKQGWHDKIAGTYVVSGW